MLIATIIMAELVDDVRERLAAASLGPGRFVGAAEGPQQADSDSDVDWSQPAGSRCKMRFWQESIS